MMDFWKQTVSLFLKGIHTLSLLLLWQAAYSQDITGSWYAQQDSTHYLLDLRNGEQGLYGLLDIPHRNQFRFSLDSITLDSSGALYFLHRGLDVEFRGQWKAAEWQISGTLFNKGQSTALEWSDRPTVARSQWVEREVPYLSEEVRFANSKAGIELSGTLTLPNSSGPFPAMVLISGSGPQNRDEEVLGHRPFRVLADHLTRNGIAVLRYDDRGTAKSGGQFRPATSRDYADDGAAALDFLKKHPSINQQYIGLLGHSEGGNIAPMIAADHPEVAFLALMAAPGVSNLDMYLVQLKLIIEDSPDDYVYERDFPFWESVYRTMATTEDKVLLREKLNHLFDEWIAIVPEEEWAVFGGSDVFKKQQIERHCSDWYHYFLQFDINDYLPKLDIPILALNGDKDRQVEAKQNLAGFEKAFKHNGHPLSKTVQLENVNHFFQPCKEGSIQEVYFLTESFSSKALKEMATWIQRVVASR